MKYLFWSLNIGVGMSFPLYAGCTLNTLKAQWLSTHHSPMEEMHKLIKSTKTHHRHFFYGRDLKSAEPVDTIKKWVSQQFSSLPTARISYFLISKAERERFFSYLHHAILNKKFDIINCHDHTWTVQLHVPFHEKRPLGVVFNRHPWTKELQAFKAPYLRLVFSRSGKKLLSFFPVMKRFSVSLNDQRLKDYLLSLSEGEKWGALTSGVQPFNLKQKVSLS